MEALNLKTAAWAITFCFVVVALAQEGESTSTEQSSNDAKDQTEFAFNVFSDIAPILALFGEQFATQYLSQSFTWLDHIIFACVPLGIVTALSATIRVQGAPWMRSFIGRARENRATAEIELMSSTSNEVCEAFNGKGIVKVMGRPQIAQIIFLPALCNQEPQDTSCGIFNLEDAVDDKGVSDSSPMTCEEYRGNSKRCRPSPHQKPADLLGPPNIQVNVASDHLARGMSEVELFFAMVIAVLLQIGVIAIAIITVVHEPTRNAVGLQPDYYSLPSYVAGSVAVSLSMLICSHAIESSTIEHIWRKRDPNWKHSDPSGSRVVGRKLSRRTRQQLFDDNRSNISGQSSNSTKPPDMSLFWIQRAQTISDQSFGSYVILGGAKQYILTSSRKEAFQTPDTTQDAAQDNTRASSRSNITRLMNCFHASRQVHRTTRNDGRSTHWEILSLLGVSLGAVGFVVQFIGLRGLAYPVSLSHLGAIVIMALVRAIIRRRLGQVPKFIRLIESRELDCLAYLLTVDSKLRHFSNSSTSQFDDMPMNSISQWTVKTPSHSRSSLARDGNSTTENGSSIESIPQEDLCLAPTLPKEHQLQGIKTGHATSSFVPLSHQLLQTRRRLGDLCRWESSETQTTLALARGIESFLNVFLPIKETGRISNSLDRIGWRIRCCWPRVEPSDRSAQYMKIGIAVKNQKWEVEIGELEAALSLWVASFEAVRSKPEGNAAELQAKGKFDWRRGASPKILFTRVLGIDSRNGALKRDISWWIGQDVARRSEASYNDPKSSMSGQDPEVVIGFHGPDDEESAQHQDRFGSDATCTSTLAILSTERLVNIFAQHFLTSFMWTVASILPRDAFRRKPSSGEDDVELRYRHQLTDDTTGGHQAWYPCLLRSSKLSDVVASMELAGLGTVNDLLLCMIPALSWCDVLPTERALDLLPYPRNSSDWNRAASCYDNVLRAGLQEELRQQRFSHAVVVKTMNFLFVACQKAKGDEVFRNHLKYQIKSLMKVLVTDGKQVLQSLSPVYVTQHQDKTYLGYFKEYMGSECPTSDIFALGQRARPQDPLEHIWPALGVSGGHIDLCLGLFPATDLWARDETRPQNWQTADLFGWAPIHYIIAKCSVITKEMERESSMRQRNQYLPNAVLPSEETSPRKSFQLLYRALDERRGTWNESSVTNPSTGPGMVHLATKLGSVKVISILLDAGVNPDSLDFLGHTPFTYISDSGLGTGVANHLLEFWKDFELQDHKGETCLHWAVRLASEGTVGMILNEKDGFRILNSIDNTGKTPLHVASQEGRYGSLKVLILNNARLEVTDKLRRTALHYAVWNDSDDALNIIKALMEGGLDLEAGDVDGYTPLHMSIMKKQDRVAMKLIADFKADPNARDKDGATPLMLACKLGLEGFVSWIAGPQERVGREPDQDGGEDEARGGRTGQVSSRPSNAKASPHPPQSLFLQKDHSDRNCAHYASMGDKECEKILKILVHNGADINAVDAEGTTPLLSAIKNQNEPYALGLLGSNAGRNTGNNYTAPLFEAAAKNCQKVVECMIAQDAKMLNYVDEQLHRTVLSTACRSGNSDIVELLLRNPRLDVNIPLGFFSPLHVSIAREHEKIVRLLIEFPGINLADEANRNQYFLIPALEANNADVLGHLLTKSIFQNGCIELLQDALDKFPQNGDVGLQPLLETIARYLPLQHTEAALRRARQFLHPSDFSEVLDTIFSRENEPIEALQPFFLLSVQLGRIATVQSLINKEVDPFQLDEDNWSCLDLARKYDHCELLDILDKYMATLAAPQSFTSARLMSPAGLRPPIASDQQWFTVSPFSQASLDNEPFLFDLETLSAAIRDGYEQLVDSAPDRSPRRTIQSDHCISPTAEAYYFEVEIVKGDRHIVVGFCHDVFSEDVNRKPGQYSGSVAINSLGWIEMGKQHQYRAASDPISSTDESNHFSDGDIVGAGVNMRTGEIYWTKNGTLLNTGFTGTVDVEAFGTYWLKSLLEDEERKAPSSAWATAPQNVAIRLESKGGKLYPAIGIELDEDTHARVMLYQTPEKPFKFQGPYDFSYET